jgi:sRNA-binding regulator protein Hfq
MSISPLMPIRREQGGLAPIRPQGRNRKASPNSIPFRFPANIVEMDAPYRNAELFYLQKQIQSQTPMVIVMEDGELVEGCIEWYDRNALKVRGRWKTLIYKSAIKYMYKLGDTGRQSFNP